MNANGPPQPLWHRIRFGWLILSTLLGAIFGFIGAPSISDRNLQVFWSAQSTFWWAVVGASIGAVTLGLAKRSLHISLLRLAEIIVVCAILACFFRNYMAAHARVQRRYESIKVINPQPINGVNGGR